MGVIKRALKRTSRKLLAKIVPPARSHQLADDLIVGPLDSAPSKRKLASLKKKFDRNSKDTAVAEALLLAVKNHLPPVQFHHVKGPNVLLSANKCIARRTQSFCQALVFSNRVILPNERVYIKVLEIAKGWSGTIRFGFTAVDPATLACRMPKHACPDMTNAGHTWARALADEVVRRNSVIHFSYNKDGLILYGINNQDCGVFHANVGTNQSLWFIVDIYGLTAAVELIDPRVHNASGELDDTLASPGDTSHTSTMYKSTSAMNEIFGQHGADRESSGRSRKKQSRKHAARQAATSNWALENTIGPSFLGLSYNPETQQYTPTGMQLPNLNSINLPSAQQNIYSPMPSDLPPVRNGGGNTTHDYYTCGAVEPRLMPSVSVANVSAPTLTRASSNSFSSSSGNVNSPPASSSSSSFEDRQDLSKRLENLRLLERRSARHQQHHQSSTSRSPRAAPAATRTPVAAARRRAAADSTQTNLRRPPADQRTDKSSMAHRVGSSNRSKVSPSSLLAQSSAKSADSKPKSGRHSSKSHRSPSSAAFEADKSNNGSPGKDCPICFERPINCVLYQCGHMCTCYECGVKQWKTESRTCPICRTIIKDVIKTYMS